MSVQDGPKVPKRGEAAWKAVKEDVAARNEQAKKAAKIERAGHMQNAIDLRKAGNERRAANVIPRPDLD